MKYRLIFVLLSIILWGGCFDESELTPSEKPEFKYTLPQGQHDYDDKIVNWYDRCGFYILYKFEPKDVYWNMNQWTEAIYDSVTGYPFASVKVELPDENYVGQQLQYVENAFLNFYPDTMLRRCMPMKLLLGKNLQSAVSQSKGYVDVVVGFDNFIISHGDQTLAELTVRKRELIKDTINILFMNRLIEQFKIMIPGEFSEVSTYGSQVPNAEMYAKGFITSSPWTNRTKEQDWKDYIRAVIKTPYSELVAEPIADDYSTFKGILNEKKDTKGVVRQKYKLMIDYLKVKHGLDLQAVGNARGI